MQKSHVPSFDTLGVAHCSDHIQGFSMGTLLHVPQDLSFALSLGSFHWCRGQVWKGKMPNESVTQQKHDCASLMGLFHWLLAPYLKIGPLSTGNVFRFLPLCSLVHQSIHNLHLDIWWQKKESSFLLLYREIHPKIQSKEKRNWWMIN